MNRESEQDLLRQFVAAGCERAFEGLVSLHFGLVYGCARRRTGEAGLAEEVAQNVFTILARKAPRLKAGSGLAGWLHKTTLHESSKMLRKESRHQKKLRALAEHTCTQDDGDRLRAEVLPHVDEAIAELSEADQSILILRFFEGRSFQEISKETGKSEAASQKQSSRALQKLEGILKRRGVVASGTALATILLAESAKAVPAGLATTISGSALASASSLTTTALITNTIQTMTYAKTKVALVVAATAAVPIGMQMHANHELKSDLAVYEQRESAFVQSSERLASLEARIATLPPEVWAATGSPDAPVASGSTRTGTPPGTATIAGRSTRSTGGGASAPNRRGGPVPAGSEATSEDLGVPSPDSESLTDMMEDPVMRRMLNKQLKIQFEVDYGPMLDSFGLEKDAREKFTQILLDRLLASAADGEALVDPESGKIDLNRLTPEMTATEATFDAQLRELLSEEQFDYFERYEDSIAEREELGALLDVLEERGSTLSPETQQALIEIMYEENNALVDSADSSDVDQNPLSINPEALLADERATQERIRARAAALLTPEQLEILTRNQESQLRLLQSGLEELDETE